MREVALQVAERIRNAVASEPFVFQGRRTKVTMSFGVALFPMDAATQTQLVRVADERLYKSKEAGRNQVTG
ncbi:MAG: diguanylate cyclase with PAS/PAC sensor protein [Elusimicrobia bacterium]|nr:MAG: diguanylate cyclase with PAS/PAC sensor protein [Elusimicrobiota bacterium]